MPQIIVLADGARDHEDGSVMLRERVNITDFESDRFATNLVERLGWAVSDAIEAARNGHGTQAVSTTAADGTRAREHRVAQPV